MTFTTRPELAGTFGMVASTHWLASAVGMKMLEADGTAFDAAVAMGFTLNVVEPHLCGPLGDMPALIKPAGDDRPTVVCGQGVSPAAASIDYYKDQGLDMIPGSGLLATVVPGAFDAWMLILRDHGRLSLREVLEPAIYYAEHGHPILARASATIAGLQGFFEAEWPTSAQTWLPGGVVPPAGRLFRNPQLAAFWTRLLKEAESVSGREAQIEAARRAFYDGFVAETIDDYLQKACVMDAAGGRRKGILTAQDMSEWRASYETAVSVDHKDWTYWKCGAWTQGPAVLQALQTLRGDDLSQLDPTGAEFAHLAVEAMKLAFADRDTYYGDPNFTDVPLPALLSSEYGAERRKLISQMASMEQRPGLVPEATAQHQDWARRFVERAGRNVNVGAGPGIGEPTMGHLSEKRGDTVHIDAIDRWGNVVSATPSGGWLQSSPVVQGLGVPLNSRAQMFWLEEGLPTSLAPKRRPRTTLSPSMASHQDGSWLSFGSPGGDQQDQWQLLFFLRMAHHQMNLQQCIDAPLFFTTHMQGSFYPRVADPGAVTIEGRYDAAVLAELRQRGHKLNVIGDWEIGRLTACRRAADGLMHGAATPRLMQAYAIGR